MGVSTLTLAKRVKATVLAHPELVERDGTQEVPQEFTLKMATELREAGDILRMHFRTIASELISSITGNSQNNVPNDSDTDRQATVKLNTLYAIRALHSISNSPNGILREKFQTRTFTIDDISEILGYSFDELKSIQDTNSIFQFKRHSDNPENPWIYSWVLVIEGVAVSRGTKQHISKLATSILKLVDLDAVSGTTVQNPVAELVKYNASATSYYWYLSNQYTVMYYHAFLKYLSLSSCMAKDYDFYNGTGPRQHPMDCYDDSPDWSLMMMSTMSPEQIIEMCDLVISNPDEADSLFKFPFITRCLVLPTNKETSGYSFETPYVMGKFYGNDKLIKYFYDDSTSSPYHKNNNGLLSGSYYIEGGRIHAVPSTKDISDYRGAILLPYFDKANKARLVNEDGNMWWVSVGENQSKTRDPIARCSYEYGIARFEKIYSPACGSYIGISSYVPETFNTIFGVELEEYRSNYQPYMINGSEQLVPQSMFVSFNGNKYLRGDMSTMYDGSQVPTAEVIANQNRYVRIEGLGLFDLENTNHNETYNNVVSNTQPEEAAA